MKKLILFSLIILTYSCKKEEVKEPDPIVVENGQMLFYTTNYEIEQYSREWEVVFEGSEIGRIEYSQSSPDCGASGYVTVDKPPGEYTVVFKSYSGQGWGTEHKVTIESGKCKLYDF